MIYALKRIVLILVLLAVYRRQAAITLDLSSDEGLIIPDFIAEKIKVDGTLDETVWQSPPIKRGFRTFSPIYGEALGLDTDIWAAYDAKTLYFAFKCHDNQPKLIKTSISRRDSIARDDVIGVIIDTLGNRQSSVELYVNPNGIQEDGFTSAVNGLAYDNSPDWVWDSSAKISDDGYTVEIAVPLESLRYKSGERVSMGVIFMRNVPRLGKWGAWPEMKAGQSQFNAMTTVEYRNLKKQLKLELLPNFTFSRNSALEPTSGKWSSDRDTNFGTSFKYGITSSITAEATFRPDFSQVESDAFQVEVNQRYPVFYMEKRPFFMEGMSATDFALVANGMMTASVYTRFIAEPKWAAKVSGTAGKTMFSMLAAADRIGNGDNAFWGIARCKRALGEDNLLGFLYSGRHEGENANSVAGADFQYRLFNNTRLTLSGLFSSSRSAEQTGSRDGFGINAMLQYGVRTFNAMAAYERYSADFAMSSAFLLRTNFEQLQGRFGPNLIPRKGKLADWLHQVQPYLEAYRLHDLGSGLNDTSLKLGVAANTALNGILQLEFFNGREVWLNRTFSHDGFSAVARFQPWAWLQIQANVNAGQKTLYDTEQPFQGRGSTIRLNTILQPNVHASINLGLIHDTLYRPEASGGGLVYSLTITNLQVIYQFNRNFLLRGAMRYNDYNDRLLTDFLASFTLIPGTVVHLGYGSIYEERSHPDDMLTNITQHLQNTRNSLFFKVSYLWRFH